MLEMLFFEALCALCSALQIEPFLTQEGLGLDQDLAEKFYVSENQENTLKSKAKKRERKMKETTQDKNKKKMLKRMNIFLGNGCMAKDIPDAVNRAFNRNYPEIANMTPEQFLKDYKVKVVK